MATLHLGYEMPDLTLIDPTPDDVLQLTDGFEQWDAQDPVVNEYKRVQLLQAEKGRVAELKQRVEESDEWRTLIQLNRQLKTQISEEGPTASTGASRHRQAASHSLPQGSHQHTATTTTRAGSE